MDFVRVGKIVNTHGIKGEIRILSSFPFKEKVFQVGRKLFVDQKEYTITSYRVHKGFDMVTFHGYTNINNVLFLMKKEVFVPKSELELEDDQVLDEELIHYEVLTNDGRKGIIKEIFYASETNKILRVLFEDEVLIPWNSPMILKINKKEKQVLVELIEGM